MPVSAAAKTTGFVLLGLSALSTCTGLALPFLPLLRKPLWVTAFLVAGELFFAASLFFLGKQYGQQLKQKIWAWLRRVFGRPPGPDTNP